MKKIVILGLGVVGQSALKFLKAHKDRVCELLNIDDFTVATFDPSIHSSSTDTHAAAKAMADKTEDRMVGRGEAQMSLHDVVQNHDIAIPSPGFNLNAYDFSDKKFVCELDFFHAFFAKPTIAITGTLGKTTVTKLLSELALNCGIRVCVGGNIGTAMLDCVDVQDKHDYAVLELSSFQLERNKCFAPDVGIWTNFSANHLDRHESECSYLQAKWKMFEHQKKHQTALFSMQLYPWIKNKWEGLASRVCFVEQQECDIFPSRKPYDIFDVLQGMLRRRRVLEGVVKKEMTLFDLSMLPDATFLQNWLVSLVALHSTGIDLGIVQKVLQKDSFSLSHEHRLEYFKTVNAVDFYNDSKATVMQATYAAVQKMAQEGRPLHVIIGGLSKGVDRTTFFATLQKMPRVRQVYVFGQESALLGATEEKSLQVVVDDVFKNMNPGDRVLFSPGGSSFDLFDNYRQRGSFFKELVLSKARSV